MNINSIGGNSYKSAMRTEMKKTFANFFENSGEKKKSVEEVNEVSKEVFGKTVSFEGVLVKKENIEMIVDKLSISGDAVTTFLESGGKITLVGDDGICLSKNGEYSTGCHGGVNRSQVLAVLLNKLGIKVLGVFAGSLLTDFGGGIHSQGYDMEFKKYSGDVGKMSRVGSKEYTKDEVDIFLKGYFKNVVPGTFLSFADCSAGLIRHLVANKENKNLEGFHIIHLPFDDTIKSPIDKNIKSNSKQAYQDFEDKLKKYITIEKASPI